jgi:hypothetical protein
VRLYLPEIGDKIRLTAPLVLNSIELNMGYGHNNRPAFWRIERGDEPWNYQLGEKIETVTLEAGTVLAFRRYFVSVHAKTNDVEVSIFAAPRRDLTPKKQGGTGQMVKLVLPLGVLNRIEYEKLDV